MVVSSNQLPRLFCSGLTPEDANLQLALNSGPGNTSKTQEIGEAAANGTYQRSGSVATTLAQVSVQRYPLCPLLTLYPKNMRAPCAHTRTHTHYKP